MAEVTYSDVQRAVNDGVGQLQGVLNELRGQINATSQQSDNVARTRQQMEDVNRRMVSVEQSVQQLIQQMQQVQQVIASNQRTAQMTDLMAQQLGELRIRFQAVEKFAQDTSAYLQRLRLKEEEEAGYRRVSS